MAVKVALKATPTVPDASELVVIESDVGAEAIVIERPFVALTAGDSESVTSTVKLVVPAAAAPWPGKFPAAPPSWKTPGNAAVAA